MSAWADHLSPEFSITWVVRGIFTPCRDRETYGFAYFPPLERTTRRARLTHAGVELLAGSGPGE